MADKETVIGANTKFSGEIRGEGSLQVRGRVEGKIHVADTVTISGGALVKADVEARAVEIAGVLIGSVVATERIHLGEKARVVGDISAPRVGIEAGAQYRGRVEMGQVEGARAQATGAAAALGSERVKLPSRVAAQAEAAPPGGTQRTAPPRVASVPVRTDVTAAAPAWARRKAKQR